MILGLLFFATIAYTVYWKTHRGYYDENNNESSDPTQRARNLEKQNRQEYDMHESEDDDDIIVRASSRNSNRFRSDGFEIVQDDSV